MKILPNKITHRNRNTRRGGFILQWFTFRRIFRVVNKGSKFFIVAQMTAGQALQRYDVIELRGGFDDLCCRGQFV
ncbi:UNVERIFIED_ORG: hypothetical protein J2791_000364 [Burkholderia contaminans]|nr:hypothetical protein [Burkholderia contaminans]